MSASSFELLEFNRLRSIIAGFCLSPIGYERVESLALLADREAIVAALDECREMGVALAERGRPSLGECRDLGVSLARIRAEGSRLRPEELLTVRDQLRAAGTLRHFFDGEKAPLLASLAGQLEGLKAVRDELVRCLDDAGEISDSASFELGEIRRRTVGLRGRIRRTLDELLSSDRLRDVFQDRLITERNGRYVVPVKADYRGRLKGFVHDESASGQTLFVEPAKTLALNNELHALQREEQREIERILLRLTALVRDNEAVLRRNQELLAHLDLRSACAEFARKANCVIPEIAEQPAIDLRQARHPLLIFNNDGSLRGDPVVPVDLRLSEAAQTLIISGPNTGGKTVALKSAGLLTLMVRAGLPLPCAAQSSIYPFAQVFADIGDEQSIEEQLSTFSGHLTRLRGILDRADGDTLVLLDEIGTGTDPAEGGALALAALDVLRQCGARVIATTHLQMVKSYALLHDEVENAAVEFDAETLAPTYRLYYGAPGASSAFLIARRLGLPQTLLDRAESYLDRDEREGQRLLERLHDLQQRLSADAEETRKLRQKAQHERDRRKQLLAELEAQRREILDKARKQGRTAVHQAEKELRTILRKANDAPADPARRSELKSALRQVEESLPPVAAAPAAGHRVSETTVGELLLIPALNLPGEVVGVSGATVELSVAGKKLRQPLKALRRFEPRRFAGRKTTPTVRSKVERDGFSGKLLLVGKRVDAALPELERFLDDALLHGIRSVEIVHGGGEGILRRAVREQLAAHRAVTSYYAAPLQDGGDNVTIAELRGA